MTTQDKLAQAQLTTQQVEAVAQWLAEQRVDIPATGPEFAAALRYAAPTAPVFSSGVSAQASGLVGTAAQAVEPVALPSGAYGWRYAVEQSAKLLRDIDRNGCLESGGEQYPNGLNCHEMAQRLDGLLAAAPGALTANPAPAQANEGIEARDAQPQQELVASLVASAKWSPAPIKTEWGSHMMVADVELSRDETLTMYATESAIDAAIARAAASMAPNGGEG